MATPLSFTAVYEPVEDGWVQARIKELPEVITAGRSLEEAKEMLEDALREYIVALSDATNGTGGVPGAKETSVRLTISA